MIYCVEDDTDAREIELYTLRATGFEAEGFGRADSFFDALKGKKPELILLDVMLPDLDGIEILKQLKKSTDTSDIPVIMATAKGSEYDKVVGLDCGADDYLAKPFGMMEMVSRVKAVLRRCAHEEPEQITSGGVILNITSHTVTVNGSAVALTNKEYELLKLFLNHPNKVYSRDTLLLTVWGTEFLGETRTVDMHIKTLRQKISGAGVTIETVRGVGYRAEAAE